MNKGHGTVVDFLKVFKDEGTCQEYLLKLRFSQGEYCPHCNHSRINHFSDGKRFRCAKCKKDFNIKTNTIFGESKISLQKWFMAIFILSKNKKGISSIDFANQLGVTQKTASFMEQRISKSLKQEKTIPFVVKSMYQIKSSKKVAV